MRNKLLRNELSINFYTRTLALHMLQRESNNDDKKGGDKGLLIRDQSEKMKSESNYYFFSALNAK